MATRNKDTVPWKVYVPKDLALAIELRYCNARGKPDYGARSHLIVGLLREFEKATSHLHREQPGLVQAVVARLITETTEEEKKKHEQQFSG